MRQFKERALDKSGIKLAPHNWASFLGLYMQLVLARGIPNFLIAEQDTSTRDLFDTSAFVLSFAFSYSSFLSTVLVGESRRIAAMVCAPWQADPDPTWSLQSLP